MKGPDRWVACGMMVLLAACAPVSKPVSVQPEVEVHQSILTESKRVRSVPKEVAQQIPILMYHSISDNPKNLLCLSPKKFEEQMRYLKSAGYNPITTDDLADWEAGKPLPVKPILLTFDDGYRDNYTDAFPILKELGFKATLYVTTGFIGGPMNLTKEMIKEMLDSGLIEFESHTLSHADLTTLPSDRLRSEIFKSKEELQNLTGVAVDSFCYPSGRYNEKVVKLVKEAGYLTAVTTKPGKSEITQGMHTLHRVRINGDITMEQFKAMLP